MSVFIFDRNLMLYGGRGRIAMKSEAYRGKRYDHIVYRAKVKKELIPMERCEKCNAKGGYDKAGRYNIQAHHPRYDVPLDVIWLCTRCHAKWHREHEPIRERIENVSKNLG